MAEAYSSAGNSGRSSYRYQYSVAPATHGEDVALWFGPLPRHIGADLATAAQTAVGNLVRFDNPAIPAAIALGNSTDSMAAASAQAASTWPSFSVAAPFQLNINQTGGNATPMYSSSPLAPPTTVYLPPGLANNFSIVNAYTWEGGRGVRCDFWRAVAPRVPE